MSKRIKGQDVNLFVNGQVIAASTSCTFNLTANSTDAATKNDGGDAMWDNPDFVNYAWNMGNESFLLDTEHLLTLLNTVINGDAKVDVGFQYEGITLGGSAIITQLQVNAPNGDNVTVSLSLDGSGKLERVSTMVAGTFSGAKIKGKSLMIALQDNTGAYHTVAASTSHSLSVSVQTSEINTKDDINNSLIKEATGKSVSISTENLVSIRTASEEGVFVSDLIERCMNGDDLQLGFGYYGAADGAAAGDDADWGTPTPLLVYGKFLCTSININGAVKENATYSAEFAGKGKPYIGTV